MNFLGSGYGRGYNSYGGDGTGVILMLLLLAIIGTVLIYQFFLKPEKRDNFNKFLKYIYDLLKFDKLILKTLLEVAYCFIAVTVTLFSIYGLFSVITNFGAILVIILGYFLSMLMIRISFEFIFVFLSIHSNTVEIKNNTKK